MIVDNRKTTRISSIHTTENLLSNVVSCCISNTAKLIIHNDDSSKKNKMCLVLILIFIFGIFYQCQIVCEKYAPVTDSNHKDLVYSQDASRTVTFFNPSWILPLTITPPPATGCYCVRVVTPTITIPPRKSATFTVAIEASEIGERTEALRFTARQGFRTQPVYAFLTYRVLPNSASQK